MPDTEYATSKGTALLICSAVGFSILFFVTPLLDPLTALEITSMRIIFTVLGLWLMFSARGKLEQLTATWRFILQSKLRLLGVCSCGVILASQLWLFAYGPLHGRGLQVSLGFFMLPIVLVLTGRFLFNDSLQWWHWLAVFFASAGVLYEIIRVGGFAWESLWISLMYPVYFAIRRIIGTGTLTGMFWEFVTVALPALIVFAVLLPGSTALAVKPIAYFYAFLIGIFAAGVLLIWVLSSKLMPLSLFGMLSYIEPLLLLVAAILLGEHINPSEFPTYAAIWVAVLIVIAGSVHKIIQSRRIGSARSSSRSSTKFTRTRDRKRSHTATTSAQYTDFPATGSIPIISQATEPDQ